MFKDKDAAGDDSKTVDVSDSQATTGVGLMNKIFQEIMVGFCSSFYNTVVIVPVVQDQDDVILFL